MVEQSFRIDDWLVEPGLGRLTRAGESVRLEPQVMKVLVCLAEQAGEVVTKEYLISNLWRTTYVSDAALARCIFQIRQALGDSAAAQKFVQTIPKKGYRLVAVVSMPRPPAVVQTQRLWFAACIALVAAILTVVVIEPASEPIKIRVEPVGIVESSANTDMEYVQAYARILDERLGKALAVFESNSGVPVLSGGESPVSTPAGIYTLRATLLPFAGSVKFEIELVDGDSDRAIWASSYDESDVSVFGVSSTAVGDMADFLGEPLPEADLEALRFSLTDDVLAYDAYDLAMSEFTRFDRNFIQNAIVLYEKAIQRDPNFGLAHARLSNVLEVDASYFGGKRIADARTAAENAMRLAPDRPEPHFAYGKVLEFEGDDDGALGSYFRSLSVDPTHSHSQIAAANIFFNNQQWADAEALFVQGIENGSNLPKAMSQLAYIKLIKGETRLARRWSELVLRDVPLHIEATTVSAVLDLLDGERHEAKSRCQRLLAVFPDVYRCLQVAAAASLITEDLDTAERCFQGIAELRPDDDYAKLGLAQVLMARGQTDEALVALQSLIDHAVERIDGGESHWMHRWIAAGAYAVSGDRSNAYRWLDEAAFAGRRNSLWDSVEPSFAALRDEPRFDRYLAATLVKSHPFQDSPSIVSDDSPQRVVLP